MLNNHKTNTLHLILSPYPTTDCSIRQPTNRAKRYSTKDRAKRHPTAPPDSRPTAPKDTLLPTAQNDTITTRATRCCVSSALSSSFPL